MAAAVAAFRDVVQPVETGIGVGLQRVLEIGGMSVRMLASRCQAYYGGIVDVYDRLVAAFNPDLDSFGTATTHLRTAGDQRVAVVCTRRELLTAASRRAKRPDHCSSYTITPCPSKTIGIISKT